MLRLRAFDYVKKRWHWIDEPGLKTTKRILLSAEQIIGLKETEISLVPAPGESIANIPIWASLQFIAGEVPYTGLISSSKFLVVPKAAWNDYSNPPYVVFDANEILNLNGGIDCFSAQPAGGQLSNEGPPRIGLGSPVTDFENTEIVLSVSNVYDLAEGDGTLAVTIIYWRVPIE